MRVGWIGEQGGFYDDRSKYRTGTRNEVNYWEEIFADTRFMGLEIGQCA